MAMIARADRLVGRAGDALLDAVVVAFALWTLVYDVALPAGARVTPLLWVSVGLCVMTVTVVAVTRARPGRHARERRPVATAVGGRRALAWGALAVAAAIVTVGLRGVSWPGAWVAPAVVVAAGVVVAGRRGRATTPTAEPVAPAYRGSLIAAVIALGLGAGSAFLFWTSTDDVYYVNRAVWVATHGAVPLRDTIFGNQTLPAMAGQTVPVAAIETLQGALAHLFGVAAPSVVYLATPPVATALAVWALWRLVRRWVTRSALPAFVVGLVFVIWSAVTLTTQWNVHLVGMWHGKSLLAAVVVPVLFTHLTAWCTARRLRTAWLLLAAGAAAVGLSSSAIFLVPLVAATAALPLLLRRDWSGLLGPVAAAAYPVAAGLAVHVATVGSAVGYGQPRPPQQVVQLVVGTGVVGAIGLAAIVVAPHLIRLRPAADVAFGVAVMSFVVLAPGVQTLFNAVTGAGPVLWRTLWVAPLAALVAAAVVVPGPVVARLLVPIAVVALLVTTGTPPWSAQHPVRFVSSPRWQIDPATLAQARLVERAAPAGAVVLAPVPVMQALAQTTTRVFTAAPRDIYALSLTENQHRKVDRVVLAHWVYPLNPPVFLTPDLLRSALTDVGVDYTCVKRGVRGKILHEAGYGPSTTVGALVCFATGAARSGAAG